MNIELKAKDLNDVLKKVSYTCLAKATLPVLRCVEIRASETGRITFTTTNLETGVLAAITGEVYQPGATIVPFKTLHETCKNWKGTIPLTVEGKELIVNNILHLKLQDHDDYSPIGEPPHIAAPATLRYDAVAKVIHAVSTDEARPVLQGICIDSMVKATDGFRLSQFPSTHAPDKSVIIPANTLKVFLKINTLKTNAGMQIEGDNVWIQIDADTFIKAVTIEGNYPDFNSILPKVPAKHIITVKTDELKSTLKTLLPFVKQSTSCTNAVKYKAENGMLTIWGTGEDPDERMVFKLNAGLQGNPIIYALNCQFVLDLLTVWDKDIISFELTAWNCPIVFKQGEHTELIMPLNIMDEEDKKFNEEHKWKGE